LLNGDPRAVLERLMLIRRPLYEGIADLRVETTGRQVRAVAADIQQRLAKRVAKPAAS
jgi:shikimate kinase